MKSLSNLVWLCMCVVLAACGGKGVIVTEDNSADYSTVKSLPPLKKPKTYTTTEASAPLLEDRDAITSSQQNEAGATVGPSYRVIEKGAEHAWLEIDDDFEGAWEFVGLRLADSDITVHHRNQAASLIAIGCGDLDDAAVAGKKSRWNIFQKKEAPLEHCALRFSKSKGKTKVMVFNRSGMEFDATAARDVFARLL